MPFVADPRKATTDPVGKLLAKFARPLPRGFVADDDAASGHHTKPEREAKIQPHGMADDLGGEPIPGVAGASAYRHPTRLLTPIVRASAADSTKFTVPTKDHLDPGFFENPRDERARRHFFGQHQRLPACVWHPWRLSLLHSSVREPSDHAEEGRMPILNIRDGEIRSAKATTAT